MRSVSIAAACLFLGSAAAGECTVGKGTYFLPSSDRIRITALLNGNPQKNVELDLFATTGVPRFSLSTKDDGVAELPQLPPGKYRVFAGALDKLRAALFLEVTMSAGGETSSFSMNLTVGSDQPQATQSMLAISEKNLCEEKFREFKGLLLDPQGSRVSGAKIEVFQFGFLERGPVVEIKAASDGSFSASLADGRYLAIFTMPGFRTELLVFEVAKKENSKDLWISMQIGSS